MFLVEAETMGGEGWHVGDAGWLAAEQSEVEKGCAAFGFAGTGVKADGSVVEAMGHAEI